MIKDACLALVEQPIQLPTETWESANHYEILIGVSGVESEDISIVVCELIVDVRIENIPVSRYVKGALNATRLERFEQAFCLPIEVDEEKVCAWLQDGLLTITCGFIE